MKHLWNHKRRLWVVLADVLLTIAAYLLANLFRFEGHIPARDVGFIWRALPVLLVIRGAAFTGFGLYRGVWAYASISDLIALTKAVTVGSAGFAVSLMFLGMRGHSWAVVAMDCLLLIFLVGALRLSLRLYRRILCRRRIGMRRAVIVGAGDAAEMLIREIERNEALNYEVLGFVDDDPRKQGMRIHGIEVLGTADQFPRLCRSLRVEDVLIAIPSASREQRYRILERCRACERARACRVVFRTVPDLSDLLHGRARIGQLQEVRPEDLIGREEVRLDRELIRQEVRGKRILVTGAGGSIGSELCRQLATFEPEQLVLFDRAESSLYFIDLELRHQHPHLTVVPIVGDILDRQRVEEVLRTYAPDIIYHAAAYKHVPLMEEHPLEGIQNNIFGTETLLAGAHQAGVKKFVFISTDKAVRPVGVMGMTKRVAEGLLLTQNSGPTIAVAVRFGNVLGSDGSVLPLFRWQIARGGPVMVTDPEASRYFMLLSEAAQLVLEAGVLGKGGEIFFLDMGEPIRILDLAQNLVRLSGLEPGRDLRIETGRLRPGERLREELVMEREDLLPSPHEKVLMVQNHQFDGESFRQDLEALRRLVVARDREGAVAQLKAMGARY